MFIEERHEAILRTLHEHGKVRDLIEKFQVTDDCIRKDLKVLENAGCLEENLWRGDIIAGLSTGTGCG